GMINPNMATMLCYVLTDASVERVVLQRILDACLPETLHAISVDGDTSTNDTLLILANGLAGNRIIQRNSGKDFSSLKVTIGEILRDLARLVVKDGEGAT